MNLSTTWLVLIVCNWLGIFVVNWMSFNFSFILVLSYHLPDMTACVHAIIAHIFLWNLRSDILFRTKLDALYAIRQLRKRKFALSFEQFGLNIALNSVREEVAIETTFRCHIRCRLEPNGKKSVGISDKKPSPRYIALRCRCHCLLLAVDCNWIKPLNTELFELYSEWFLT